MDHGITQLHYLIPIAGTRITIENKAPLYYDEKLITFLSTKVGKTFFDAQEKNLIQENPVMFSSFYKIDDENYKEKYNLVYCFAHYLIYYTRLLNILLSKGISPLCIWNFIKQKCQDCPKCVSRSCESGEGGRGVCTDPLKYFSDLCSFNALERYVIKHETDKRNYIIINELYKEYKIL